MNQTQELARVKSRIKALTEKTVANGCTEAEAMSAAEMVGRLAGRARSASRTISASGTGVSETSWLTCLLIHRIASSSIAAAES